jgi:hypothetical protein
MQTRAYEERGKIVLEKTVDFKKLGKANPAEEPRERK